MDIYSKERLEQVMNDMKTKVLPQIKSEIEKRAKKNTGIHNEATCPTTAGTAAKAVIAPSSFELSAGATIIVTFTNAISAANATLTFGTAVDDTAEDYAEKNPATEGWYVLSGGDFTPTQDTEPQNGTTYYIVSAAKPIYYRGAALPANLVKAGMSLIMRYNGTQWDIISNIEALDDYLQVNAQNFSNAQKLQARTNIGAQENVTDMAKLGCGIGTCSTDSGTALVVSLTDYELVKNGHVSVNFEHDVPAGATLNINGKGAKQIIYKGAAIEADTISADDTVMFCYNGSQYVVTSLGGEGGSVTLVEYLSINLTSDVSTPDPGLVGATVMVTDDDNSETILSTTWQGTALECTIDVGINYTITVGSLSDYSSPSSRTFKARAGYTRTETFNYELMAVDLGLPSGLKWAKQNIGANNPWEDGLYFSWGNVIGHESGSPYVFNSSNYNSTPGAALTGDIAVGTTYDAARAIMGEPWKMPTISQLNELKNYTDYEWVSNYNGKQGYKFMKKTDHSVFIFLPSSGFCYNSATSSATNSGFYLSRSYDSSANEAKYMSFDSTVVDNRYTISRFAGSSIRAVR